jgi:hypothetical protein
MSPAPVTCPPYLSRCVSPAGNPGSAPHAAAPPIASLSSVAPWLCAARYLARPPSPLPLHCSCSFPCMLIFCPLTAPPQSVRSPATWTALTVAHEPPGCPSGPHPGAPLVPPLVPVAPLGLPSPWPLAAEGAPPLPSSLFIAAALARRPVAPHVPRPSMQTRRSLPLQAISSPPRLPPPSAVTRSPPGTRRSPLSPLP